MINQGTLSLLFERNNSPENVLIQDVDDFVSSLENIWSVTKINVPPALQWMGTVRIKEFKQLIKASQQSTNDSSPFINVLWSEKLHVGKKQIHH